LWLCPAGLIVLRFERSQVIVNASRLTFNRGLR
jgi:hypothetical protein